MKPTYEQLVEQMKKLVDATTGVGRNPPGWLWMQTTNSADLLKQVAVGVAQVQALPTVVLEINGGVINLARSSVPLRLVVLDQDVEGGDESNIIPIDGEMVYLTDIRLEVGSDPGQGGVFPDVVQAIVQQVDAEFAQAGIPDAPRA